MNYPIRRKPVLLVAMLLGAASPLLAQTRHPVITQVDILFSMVSHFSHISDRVSFYNGSGSPKGSTNYAVPHLVYEPVVTLYNPYNEPLTIRRPRIKIWDPPVGFTFTKNGVFLRDAFAAGEFQGLARFQIANQYNVNARKSFTLRLSSLTDSNHPGAPVVLQAGESMTFSTWVETNWTWGLETAGGYSVRSFFDWNASNDFTNRDGRTGNVFGVEAVSSQFPHIIGDSRAGFQTDGLSLASARPQASLYDFELANNWAGNWVAIRTTETVGVQAKAMRTVSDSLASDFQVDLLEGRTTDPGRDLVKTFPLSLSGIIQNEAAPVVSRIHRIADILQTPADLSPGGKTPFACLTMIAKASAIRHNRFYTTPALPTKDLYELHFREVVSFFPTPLMPSDAPTSGLKILAISRSGDTLFIDFTGAANPDGISPGVVRGTSSIEDGFPDDLSSVTTMMTSQSGSGIYKAIVDISGRGDRYFVRIEQ